MENNLNIYIENCKIIILKYEESKKIFNLSCKDRVINEIKKECEGKNIVIEDVVTECNFILANITFDLLASGEFHIYRGQLSEMSIAPSLVLVFNNAIDYLLNNNKISALEYKCWRKDLIEAISEVG